MKDIKIGDIVLVNGSRYGIVNDIDYHLNHQKPPYDNPDYWISFDGEQSSAWFAGPFIEPHISKEEETNQYMKDLVRVLNKLR